MRTKVIPFAGGYFKSQKPPILTSKMIVSLLAAIEKQKTKTPFGPADIKGSLLTLIRRGLIIRKEIKLSGPIKFQWQVSEEAIILLEKLGIKS